MGTSLDLSRFARIDLGTWPTPLQECPRLSDALGGPRIVVKRDDVNGLGAGGNKLRKLEFLLGHALENGADAVITFGGVQTNHGRQTAAACARLGLRCELVLVRRVTCLPGSRYRTAPRSGDAYDRSGNVALDLLYGANVHVCDDDDEAAELAGRLVGERTAVLPVGGSSAHGVLGYVAAAEELHEQVAAYAPSRIVCAIGSAGTAAGLALGAALLDWPVILDGVAVSTPVQDKPAEVRRLVGETADLLGAPHPSLDHVRVTGRAVGPGYGVPTEQVWEAMRLFGSTEGITLDPVYTGKAAAALIEAIRLGEIGSGETVVFVHTGGLPGVFAYAPELMDSLDRQL